MRNRIFKKSGEISESDSKYASVSGHADYVTTRPTKYRPWSEIAMREAMNDVYIHGVSISKSANVHGIPRSTLNDHILGKVLPEAKSGRPTALSFSEETDLVDFLLHSSSIGFGFG